MHFLDRIPRAEIERELIRKADDSLYRFAKLAFPYVDTAKFKDNWHLPLICEHLQAVSLGQIRRLIVNVPPGTMKSLLISVLWPAWEWIFRETTKWMFASYDASLVGNVQGGKVITLMQSEWYIQRWGDKLKDKAPGVSMFETKAGGFRFSTSPGGKGTGRHVDIQVVDDPNKPQDTQGTQSITAKALEATLLWFKATASSRAVDAATFRRVIVMQRIHSNDLAGAMLSENEYVDADGEKWFHVCIPMRYETTTCVCGNIDCTPNDPRTEEGELLWPERYPENVVKHQETIGMGPSVAAAQLQQRPVPKSGGIFGNDWLRYWHHNPDVLVEIDPKFPCRDRYCRELPKNTTGEWIQSWDMTFKGTDGTDFVAGGVWWCVWPDAYLMYQICRRLSFVKTCKAMLRVNQLFPQAITKLIEDKANGPAVVSILKKTIPGLILVNPEGGKESRAHAVSGAFEAGNVFIPHPSLFPWVPAYRVQLVTFPKGVNDDMVDQTTQALLRLQKRYVPLVEAMRRVKADLEGKEHGIS